MNWTTFQDLGKINILAVLVSVPEKTQELKK